MSIDLMKEHSLTLKMLWSWKYPTTKDVDYADDLALLENTPVQPESLLHGLEQVTRSIGLQVNSDKPEFVHSKQDGTISTLNGKTLKLVDCFTYFSSNISSMESGFNITHKKRYLYFLCSYFWRFFFEYRPIQFE